MVFPSPSRCIPHRLPCPVLSTACSQQEPTPYHHLSSPLQSVPSPGPDAWAISGKMSSSQAPGGFLFPPAPAKEEGQESATSCEKLGPELLLSLHTSSRVREATGHQRCDQGTIRSDQHLLRQCRGCSGKLLSLLNRCPLLSYNRQTAHLADPFPARMQRESIQEVGEINIQVLPALRFYETFPKISQSTRQW